MNNLTFFSSDRSFSYMEARLLHKDFEAATEVQKCEMIAKVFDLYNKIGTEEMTSYCSLPEWLCQFTPPYIYVKILDDGISELKKENIAFDLNLAVDILTTLIKQNAFIQKNKGKWYSQKAFILDKLLNRANEAAEILIEGFNSNISQELKEFLHPRAQLLARRKKNPIDTQLKKQLLEQVEKGKIRQKDIPVDKIKKQPIDKTGRGKTKFETCYADDSKVQNAEEYCISRYINKGVITYGRHWEGKIVKLVFYILFWDIINKPLRGVRGIFLSLYQTYPLDMYCKSFYTNRKSSIEKRLKEIEESPIEETFSKMEALCKSRPETLESAEHRELDDLLGACRQLRPRALAALCRRYARNPDTAPIGFPDLTLWRDGPPAGQIAFVEVKTDSDKPSKKQIKWLHYMKQHDIDGRFCYVGTKNQDQDTEDLVLDDWNYS